MNRFFRTAPFLSILLAISNATVAQSPADLDENGVVEGTDVFAFLQQWYQEKVGEATGTQVGWIAQVGGGSPTYGVSGTAVVTSATSIRLENFDYKNNGPDVVVYLIVTDSTTGFTVAEAEAGLNIHEFETNSAEPYVNQTLDLTLPPGTTVQPYSYISIWCRLARVNFGSGRFMAP